MSITPSNSDKTLVFGADGEQDVRTAEVDQESLVESIAPDLVKYDFARIKPEKSTEIE
ncbi:MAG: hypothetical protein Q7K26_01615 [bacterium]|nr:hypothetical protein [bacterium]